MCKDEEPDSNDGVLPSALVTQASKLHVVLRAQQLQLDFIPMRKHMLKLRVCLQTLAAGVFAAMVVPSQLACDKGLCCRF